jgi:sulfide dehydrogenase cytochrome subunit
MILRCVLIEPEPRRGKLSFPSTEAFVSIPIQRIAGFLATATFGMVFTVIGIGGAVADPDIGRTLASQCAQCHGTNGKSVGEIDSIGGENASSMYHELLEMKAKTGATDIMHVQIRAYTDTQLLEISKYLATLPHN